MVIEVGLGAHNVGDLLLWPRRNGFVSLELRNARLTRCWDVVVRSFLVGHGESFGRHHRQRMPILGDINQVSSLVAWSCLRDGTLMHRVAFSVDDIDAALEIAARHDCHPLRGVATYGDVYKLTYLRGPSGILVMLAQDLRSTGSSGPTS